jgi:hypothetical protein
MKHNKFILDKILENRVKQRALVNTSANWFLEVILFEFSLEHGDNLFRWALSAHDKLDFLIYKELPDYHKKVIQAKND